MEFNNKRVLVTGAASGIGAAATRLFIERGARVFAADRNAAGLGELERELGPSVISHQVDLSDMEAVQGMVRSAERALGGLDVLVNNAGIGHVARVGELELEDWRQVMAVDLDAVFVASRYALPSLVASRGCIVCTASISGMSGDYGFAAYNTAKAGVIALVRNMAIDYAPEVRVNAVCPGLTHTALLDVMPQQNRDAFIREIPMHRAARAEEIAEAIAFLSSERASFITGQNLVVDGGMMARTGQPNVLELRRLREAEQAGKDSRT